MEKSKKNSKLTVKTSSEKDFQTTLNNIYKFVQINPDMYSEFEIIHQGEATFQQLSQHCLSRPTEEEKKSAEFKELVRSFDFEIINAYENDKMDVDVADVKDQKLMKSDKKTLCEDDSGDSEDEIKNIEIYMEETLKRDRSERINFPSINATVDQIGRPNSDTIKEAQTIKNLKLQYNENEHFGNSKIIPSPPTKHDVKVYSSDEILDLIICEAEYPSLLPPEYCDTSPSKSKPNHFLINVKTKDISKNSDTQKKTDTKIHLGTDHSVMSSEISENDAKAKPTDTHIHFNMDYPIMSRKTKKISENDAKEKSTNKNIHSSTYPIMSSETKKISENDAKEKSTDANLHSSTDYPIMSSETKKISEKGAEEKSTNMDILSNTGYPVMSREAKEASEKVSITDTPKKTGTTSHSGTDRTLRSCETMDTSENSGTPKLTNEKISSGTDQPLIISEIKRTSDNSKKTPGNIASMRKWMDHTFTKRKLLLSTNECIDIVRKYPGFQYLVVVKDEYNRITDDNNRIAALEDKLRRRFNRLLRVNPGHNSLLKGVLDKFNKYFCSTYQDAKKTAATLILCISLCVSLDALMTFQEDETSVMVKNEILYPKMIVVGDPFLKCRVTVFTDNVAILELDNVFDGLIAVYCLYYIFNISYGRTVKRLMEYLDFLVGLEQTTFSEDLFKVAPKNKLL